VRGDGVEDIGEKEGWWVRGLDRGALEGAAGGVGYE